MSVVHDINIIGFPDHVLQLAHGSLCEVIQPHQGSPQLRLGATLFVHWPTKKANNNRMTISTQFHRTVYWKPHTCSYTSTTYM